MSKYFTGTDGTLSIDGVSVARARNITIDGSIETLETTTLADNNPTYIQGRRSYSGSCTIYYYEEPSGNLDSHRALQNIFSTTTPSKTQTFAFRVTLAGQYKNRLLEFNAYINSIGLTVSTGDVISADVNFTVTGPLTTTTISDQ
jgi:hypothetical protein